MAETVPTTREGLLVSNHTPNRMGNSRRVDHPDEPGIVLNPEFYWEAKICLSVSLLPTTKSDSGLTPLAPVLSIYQPGSREEWVTYPIRGLLNQLNRRKRGSTMPWSDSIYLYIRCCPRLKGDTGHTSMFPPDPELVFVRQLG